jgi:VWFA-related protein
MALLCLSWNQTQVVSGQSHDSSKQEAPYHLRVTVEEVDVTFHASDAHGHPVDDLKLEEIDLFDNGRGPGKILALQQLRKGNTRLALLVDTSGSVAEGLSHTRAIAYQAVHALLVDPTDSGLLVTFGKSRDLLQPWTNSVGALTSSTRKITASSSKGTGMYDALLSTCFHDLGKDENKAGRNVLLLFTDGEDTDSYATFEAAANACQRANTAIYAFDMSTDGNSAGLGQQSLRLLADETGGRFFAGDKTDLEVRDALQIIRSDLSDGYRLIYRPAQLKRDGSFHRIVLAGPQRVASIAAVSGFYATKP